MRMDSPRVLFRTRGLELRVLLTHWSYSITVRPKRQSCKTAYQGPYVSTKRGPRVFGDLDSWLRGRRTSYLELSLFHAPCSAA